MTRKQIQLKNDRIITKIENLEKNLVKLQNLCKHPDTDSYFGKKLICRDCGLIFF